MRRSDMATVLFLLSGFVPVAATAQQATTDADQATQARPQQMPQPSDQAQTQNNPAQPGQTPQQPGQGPTQSTRVEPPHTPQQTDQMREQERRSAEGTRINRDWTARQQAEQRMEMDRMRQRHMMGENEDHQAAGPNWRRDDDDMYRSPRYGSADRGEGRYSYEARPYPRVKTCIEYENGDEFCRYRD